MSQSKTTVGALLDRYENGEIELTEMEVRSFKSLPRSTPVFGFEVKPKLKDRFATLGGPVPTKAQPELEKEKEVFEFLDALRESGVTNMYGAGAYVEEEFDMETAEGESQLELCAYCFLIASWENSLTDEAITQEEFDAIKAELDKQYGRTS